MALDSAARELAEDPFIRNALSLTPTAHLCFSGAVEAI